MKQTKKNEENVSRDADGMVYFAEFREVDDKIVYQMCDEK